MPTASRILALVGVVAFTLPVVAQVNLKPGRYETTAQIDMPNFPMKPQKNVECITAEDLKDFSKMVGKLNETENCKVSDYRTTGNKVTFNTTCVEDGERYTMSTEMIFDGDSFSGLMKSTAKGREMTIKTTAKRIGDCP